MYSNLFQANNQDTVNYKKSFVYLVNTPEQSSVFDTIEQVLEVIEPYIIAESIHTGEVDLFYEVPYFIDCQGYAKGQSWEVSIAPRL